LIKKAAVAIVGAGPAGSYAALKLAKKGFSPIVIEEHPQPGYPEHCTGHVPISLLNNLEVKLPTNIIQNKFDGLILHLPDMSHIKIPFQKLSTCLIDRAAFDLWLAKIAIKEGAHYLFSTRVESINTNKNINLTIRELESSKKYKLNADIVIDGEGYPPSLLNKLQISKKKTVVNAVQGWFDNLTEIDRRYLEVYLTNQYAPGFYAWIAPMGSDTGKVGLATITGNPLSYFKDFKLKHPLAIKKLKQANQNRIIGHQIPLGKPILTSFNNVLPVGDSARHVKPLTGGGLALSLLYASLSAEIISKMLTQKKSNLIKKTYSNYANLYNPCFQFMLASRDLLFSLDDSSIIKIVSLLKSRNILIKLVEGAYLENNISLNSFFKNTMLSIHDSLYLLYYLNRYTHQKMLKFLHSLISMVGRPLPSLKFNSK
jgi:digeranylgeranylglycerophospholipid reductase